MALLAKGGDSFDDEHKQVSLSTEPLVCPECGTEVPPWVGRCPEDGTEVVTASERPPSGPAVPAHLLDDLDDLDAPEADASDDDLTGLPSGDDRPSDAESTWPE